MVMRILALLVLPLSLSACWSGGGFYAKSEAVPAIDAGKYIITDVNGPPGDGDDANLGKRMNVSYKSDGSAVIESTEDGDVSEGILVKLGEQPGLYVAQADLGATIPKVGSSLYALINIIPGGYQIAVPRCDQKRIGNSRAVVSGLLVGKRFCRFNDRAELELALLDYADDPIRWVEYRKIEKRKKSG
jgi:hypothetical protein